MSLTKFERIKKSFSLFSNWLLYIVILYLFIEIAAGLALDSYKKNLIQGGPKTDMKDLYNNLEFFNILTFKVETFNIEIGFLNFYINALSKLSEKIDKRVNTLS